MRGCALYSAIMIILCSTILFSGWKLLNHIRGPTVCQVFGKQTFPSPDHRWTVVVEQEACSIAFMNIGAVMIHVDLVTDRSVLLQDIPILSADTLEFDPHRLRIAWSAPGVVQVGIPWPAHFTVFAKEVDGVRVDLRYDVAR